MQAIVHAADIQDRDGGVLLMGALFGPNFLAGLRSTCRHVNLEIVKRSELRNFVVLPKRWIVERTIAWLNRCRRLANDWECRNRSALAFLRWASIRLMLRRLCQNAQ